MEKLAFSVNGVSVIADCGKTVIYEELNSGRLVGKKIGRKTVILAEALNTWLNSLPDYKPRTGQNNDQVDSLPSNLDAEISEKAVTAEQLDQKRT